MKVRVLLLLLAVISGSIACTSEEAAPTPTATPTQSPAPSVSPTPTPFPSEIYKSGLITENETWSGIVHITGDITVRDGTTLTILPGTTVLFAAHQDDQHSGSAVPLDEWISRHNDPTWTLEYAQSHSGMNVFGKLIAQGTPENRIIFTSDSPTPDGADWVQVHIGDGSIVEYCIIEYSRGGVDVKEGTGNSVLISHNIIRYNLWTACTVHSSSSTVTYNEIYRSGGHQGIAVIGAGSAPYIANNRIEHCAGGINVDVGTSPIIEDNVLTNNNSGIGVLLSTAVIQRNLISAPTGAAYDFTHRGEPVYFATINTMGGHDETQGITIGNSSPTISSNDISDYGKGIVIMGNSSPDITFNTISGCLGGIMFEPSFLGSPGISMNNIYNNSDNINLQPGFTGVLDAANNWWGTVNEADIAKKINDSVDDPSRGTVAYKPFLTEPVETE